MKRKKGAKGSFKKVKKNDFLFMSEPNSSSFSIDGENNVGQTGEGQGKGKFELEVEQPTTINNKITKASNRDPDNASSKIAMKAGHNRVKVKLKSSKLLESHKRSSDVHMSTVSIASDTDRSNSQFVTEINDMTFGKIDATCSVGQTLKPGKLLPENPARKFGSIKIKSSRTSGLSDFSLKQMNFKVSHNDTRHNTNDLSAALTVIRKVMKMDAAGPFNAPVNPVALGIPDYFDIIDNPMDFGSICQDLELGTKYKNSLDVYNDVQFIWDNCYKYNNKGDYIMELMKRVKKNFMKYWTAAGLLTEISVGTQDVHRPRKGKSTSKRKSKHKRRRHGIDGHKSNCLCAVCVVRRRRKEREEHSASLESQMIVSHTGLSNEPKLEVTSAENPCSKGTVSSFDRSPDTDADAEMAEEAGKVELPTSALEEPERFGTSTTNWEAERDPDAADNEAIGNSPHDNGAKDDSSDQQFCGREWHHSNSSKHGDKKDDDDEIQHRELNPREQQMKLLENSNQQENHSVLWLCGRLFPGNQNSIWNGPHSFNRRRPFNKQNNNNNPLRSALATARL